MLEITLYYNDERQWYAARFRNLGLTAYGDTSKESMHKLIDMYASAYKAHELSGTLDKWLVNKASGEVDTVSWARVNF